MHFQAQCIESWPPCEMPMLNNVVTMRLKLVIVTGCELKWILTRVCQMLFKSESDSKLLKLQEEDGGDMRELPSGDSRIGRTKTA